MWLRINLILICFVIYLSAYPQTNVIDSLKQIISTEKRDVEEAKAYNLLAQEYVRLDVAKAKAFLYKAITLGRNIQNARTLSNSYSQMVTLFHNAGNMDSAAHYLNVLKKLGIENKSSDKDAVRANYFSTAGLFYKKTGNVKEAIFAFKQSIALSEKLGNKESTAGQLLNLGNVYMNQGDYKNALQYHLRALRLFEELGNQKGESFCYQSISNSFIELKQYDKALQYANKSMALKTRLNDKRGLGTSQSSFGQIYFGLNNYDKAMYHFTSALTIAKEFKLIPEEVKIFFNIGKIHVAKKEITAATEYFNKAKEQAKQIGDSATMAAVEVQLITMQSNIAKTDQSEKKLETNLKMIKNTGNLPREVSGYKNMAEFYAANKQYDKALEYTTRYYELNDSIESNDLKLQMKQMEDQYTVEKKEKEIALLKKDRQLNQQQIKQQRFFLIGSLTLAGLALIGLWLLISRYQLKQKMKELQLRNQIAADLHDEVGSSLSSIHLLSRIAAQHQDTKVEGDIMARVSNNAHETMEKMSDIVWMIKPGENEGHSLVERMQRFLYEMCTHQNIEYNFNADELSQLKLTMPQRKNVYLIFKEAVNNAIKYSGTDKLDVFIGLKNSELVMNIKDYGKGFDERIIIRGNGLANMKVRASELKGNLFINSSGEKGTSLQLNIPV